MNTSELLLELFGRVPPLVSDAVEGLDAEALRVTPAGLTNSIGWLVWHLTRVQDHHMADILEEQQLWVTGDWANRFGLTPDPSNTGYGHSPSEVASVRPESPEAVIEYHDAVAERTRAFLESVTEEALDRIVDERWNPPVTLGVRLVSIADDDLQHVGQAAYARGVLAR
jgi:uncharacterized damage-inducible protein DinB